MCVHMEGVKVKKKYCQEEKCSVVTHRHLTNLKHSYSICTSLLQERDVV